jgi:hypothetical protein
VDFFMDIIIILIGASEMLVMVSSLKGNNLISTQLERPSSMNLL